MPPFFEPVTPSGEPVLLAGYRTEPARLRTLLRRTAAQDRRAFTRLYDALAPIVTGVAFDVLDDRFRAAAVTSAVFVEVWQDARAHLDADTDVFAWVEEITLRRAGGSPTADELWVGPDDDTPSLGELLVRTPAARRGDRGRS